MKQDRVELTEKAWISRLWVLYGRLPEPFKEGLINLAQCLAQKAENTGEDRNICVKTCRTALVNCGINEK